MNIEPTALGDRDAYKILIGSVVPRPIAWVSTVSEDGRLNLAPYSFFQAVCSDPPTVVVSVGRRADGKRKDTGLNALATGEFVVNIVNMQVAEAMNVTSCDYPLGVDEFEMAGLRTAASNLVRPPRVAEAPIAFECKLVQQLLLGRSGSDNLLIFGEVVSFYVRDDLYDHGRIDPIGL